MSTVNLTDPRRRVTGCSPIFYSGMVPCLPNTRDTFDHRFFPTGTELTRTGRTVIPTLCLMIRLVDSGKGTNCTTRLHYDIRIWKFASKSKRYCPTPSGVSIKPRLFRAILKRLKNSTTLGKTSWEENFGNFVTVKFNYDTSSATVFQKFPALTGLDGTTCRSESCTIVPLGSVTTAALSATGFTPDMRDALKRGQSVVRNRKVKKHVIGQPVSYGPAEDQVAEHGNGE